MTISDDRETTARKLHEERPILPIGEDIESPMIFAIALVSLTLIAAALGMFGGVSIFG